MGGQRPLVMRFRRTPTNLHRLFRHNKLENYSDVLTPDELRRFLNIGKDKTYELLQNGTIQSLRIGRIYCIPKIYINKYLLSLNVI